MDRVRVVSRERIRGKEGLYDIRLDIPGNIVDAHHHSLVLPSTNLVDLASGWCADGDRLAWEVGLEGGDRCKTSRALGDALGD